MLNIKRVEIEGFRGFPQKEPFEFTNPVILLFGGNHQGKSSMLNAIEWCLYGDSCIGEKSGIRERVGTGDIAWRLVNDNTERVQINLELEDEKGCYFVTRELEKGKYKKGKGLKIHLPDETEKQGDEAERELAKLIRLSFKDFATTIYQHQETIHDFIIQKPSEQSDAIDRLLGLSDYRNILDGIRRSDISKIQKEVAQEFSKFQIRIQEAIRQRQKDLDDKKIKAKDKGIEEEELNESKLIEMAKHTNKDLADFAQLLGVGTKAILLPSSWEETQTFVDKVTDECNRLWAESPEIKEQQKILKKRTQLVSLKTDYENQFQNLQRKNKKLQDFEKRSGSRNKIKENLEKITNEIKEVTEKIKSLSPNASLIEEGISILKSAPPSEDITCPLCGEKKPDLLDHLRNKWEKEIKIKVKGLTKQEKALEQTNTDYENLIKEHIRLADDAKNEKEILDGSINRISAFLKRKLTKKDDPAAIISIEIEKINFRLNEIKDAIKNKREKIEYISEKTNLMCLLYDVLLLKNKLGQIEKITNTTEYKKQESIKDEISNLVSDVDLIIDAIKSCMKKEAEDKISSARDAIDRIFRKITNNPAFRTLNIKVEEDPKTGSNYYIFEDQDGKRPLPILSQGDLNSLALSIFLGLTIISEGIHPLSFILMDDPSQSLDSLQKSRLIEILDEISDNKNIIISTMDAEFQELLKSRITKAKTIYKFSSWEPKKGPKISREL